MTVRLIGSARPPRPLPLQAGPRGLVLGVVPRVGVTILSCSCRTRSESVRRDPLSSWARVFLAVHLDSSCCPRKSRNTGARLCLALPEASIALPRECAEHLLASSPDRPASCRLRDPAESLHQRAPSTPANPRSRSRWSTLRRPLDRPGLPPPARLASRICQPYFVLDRPWAPYLQRFLSARRRTTLSGRAVLLAVLRLAASRLRGFEHLQRSRSRARLRTGSPAIFYALRRIVTLRADAFAVIDVVHANRRVAPLMVVPPLRG